MSLLFLGVGNLERADDGVGPFVAMKLAESGALVPCGVEVLPHSGEGVSLMHLWEEADKVVVVDAMRSGSALGRVQRFDAINEVLRGGVFRYSSHLFGLAEAVEVSRKLGKLPKELIIYGIEGKEFSFGESFSKPVAKAVAGVLAAVLREFGVQPAEMKKTKTRSPRPPASGGKAKAMGKKKASKRKPGPVKPERTARASEAGKVKLGKPARKEAARAKLVEAPAKALRKAKTKTVLKAKKSLAGKKPATGAKVSVRAATKASSKGAPKKRKARAPHA